jgi:soluble lytic murein transglycosylase-like protein
MIVRRCARAALAAFVIVASGSLAGQALSATQALTPWDAQLYSAAFDAAHHGDFATVDAKLSQVTDKCLVGMVLYEKLTNPKASSFTASYDQLTAWLANYGDLPGAKRIWELAKKRKPSGAPDPAPPASMAAAHTWSSLDAAQIQSDLALADPDTLGPKAARQAFNAGDFDTARKIGDSNGDHFTAALAAFRKQDLGDAFRRFQAIALDVSGDPWARSQGAYWAARTAIAKGEPEKAPQFLKIASQFPNTFYGLVAERQLGLEPAIHHGGWAYSPAAPVPYLSGDPQLIKASAGADLDQPELQTFVTNDPRAHRALALAELGQKADAGLELRAGLSDAADDAARANWTALAQVIGVMFAKSPDQQFINEQDYPMPELHARGGITVDKALLYALIRRESAFNTKAVSWAGAYGLMQVMPATAGQLEGDDRLRRMPAMLFEPSINLRVGQDYLAWLMSQGCIEGDVLRAVAAYDGGSVPIATTLKALPSDADAILLIESIPVPESRDYVKRVMASYWIYRRLMGKDTRTLDAVAAGAHNVNVALDQPATAYASYSPPAATGSR